MEARVLVSVRKPEDVDKVVKAILLLAKEHGVAIVNPASIFNLAWDISFALRGRDKESGDAFLKAVKGHSGVSQIMPCQVNKIFKGRRLIESNCTASGG